MQLVCPIGGGEHALRVDHHEAVGRIGGKSDERGLEIDERLANDRSALCQVPTAVIQRRLEPWSGAGRVDAIGDREVVTMADDRNTGGVSVPKCK